jgi:hypothetical protein
MKDKRDLYLTLVAYFALITFILIVLCITEQKRKIEDQETMISNVEELVGKYEFVPTPTNTPTSTPTNTPTPTPTATPTPICEISNQQFYDECVARGMVTPAQDEHISVACGVFYGESGRETYYNLRMDLCVWYMRELGYDEEEYPYWIRDDGAKMLGNYVMCAANWSIRPKGTLLETSLGTAIVVDTGEFVSDYPYGVDLAVDW